MIPSRRKVSKAEKLNSKKTPLKVATTLRQRFPRAAHKPKPWNCHTHTFATFLLCTLWITVCSGSTVLPCTSLYSIIFPKFTFYKQSKNNIFPSLHLIPQTIFTYEVRFGVVHVPAWCSYYPKSSNHFYVLLHCVTLCEPLFAMILL